MATPPTFSAGAVLTAAQMNKAGMWLVTPSGATNGTVSGNKVTIGNAVSSVTVSGVFSSDFDNYRIIINGVIGSATSNLGFQLSGITGSVYNQLGYYQLWGASARSDYAATGTSVIAGETNATASICDVELKNPYLSVRKFGNTVSQSVNNQYSMPFYINSSSSATGFILTPGSGTITGGTIRVYGYNNG